MKKYICELQQPLLQLEMDSFIIHKISFSIVFFIFTVDELVKHIANMEVTFVL